MIRSVIGYSVLFGMTSVLFILALLEPFDIHGLHALPFAGLVVLAGLFFEEGREFVSVVLRIGADASWGRMDVFNFLFVAGGALVTFFLSIESGLGLGPVVASSLVGIAVAVLNPAYAVPAFCGSFVGMACGSTYGHVHLTLAAVLAGIVYVLSKCVFDGVGGKLGTIAFAGCVFATLLTHRHFPAGEIPPWEVGRSLVLVSVAGAVITYVLSIRLKLHVVLSSGIVGLAAGLLLPLISANHGMTMALMAFCASFAGMSARRRIANEACMAVAGLVCATIFIYGAPHLGGAGGKLGTIAFGSVIFVFGLQRAVGFSVRKLLPERFLWNPVVFAEKCTICGECVQRCPAGIWRRTGDSILAEGARNCKKCLACATACPEGAIAFRRGISAGHAAFDVIGE